jgi:hypothetical protein
MAESPLARKLLIKPENIVLVVNPPEGFRELLGELPVDANLVEPGEGPGQVVLLFVRSQAEMKAKAERALEALTPGGVFWIAYPKVASKTSDLSREKVSETLSDHNWRPVTQIAIDDTWSAMRFRPAGDVRPPRS